MVFAALFTAAVCWALERLLFRRLGINLRRGEHDLLAAVTGAAMLSLAVFLLCSVKMARTTVFAAFGVAILFMRRRKAAADIQADPARWGLRPAKRQEAGRLYEIP